PLASAACHASLHDALPIFQSWLGAAAVMWGSSELVMAAHFGVSLASFGSVLLLAVRIHQLQRGWSPRGGPVPPRFRPLLWANLGDRKSTRLNSSHVRSSYA